MDGREGSPSMLSVSESANEGYQSAFWEGQANDNDPEKGEVAVAEESSLLDIPIGHSSAPSMASSTNLSRRRSSLAINVDALQFIPDSVSIPKVALDNPEKHGEGFKDAYVTYEVITSNLSSHEERKEFRVRRRYQDFLRLLDKLGPELEAGIIVPPIPEKNTLGFMDRFSPDFIKKRQLRLERFLQRILIHPQLSIHPALRAFLTQPVLGLSSEEAENEQRGDGSQFDSPNKSSSMVGQIGESIAGVLFRKGRPVEERFQVMKNLAGMLESNFDRVAEDHAKLIGEFKGLADAVTSSATALSQLSSAFGHFERLVFAPDNNFSDHSSTTIARPVRGLLADYGQVLEEEAVSAASIVEQLGAKVQLLLADYADYCQNARQALKLRDQRQFDVQEMTESLTTATDELAVLSGTGDAEVDRFTAGKTAVFNFLNEKVDQLRGLDPIAAKSERKRKFEQRIVDLEISLEKAKAASAKVDETIVREFSLFQQVLRYDFAKNLVPNMKEVWHDHLKRVEHCWDSFAQDTLGTTADL